MQSFDQLSGLRISTVTQLYWSYDILFPGLNRTEKIRNLIFVESQLVISGAKFEEHYFYFNFEEHY